MNTRKRLAAIMTFVMLATMMIMPVSAMAAETWSTRTIAVGGTNYIYANSNEKVANSATVSDSNVLSVTYVNDTTFLVTGKVTGTAVVTFWKTNTTTGAFDSVSVPYTVGSSSTGTTANVSVVAGGYDDSTSTYYSAYDLYSSDSSVATAQNYNGKVRVNGHKAGTATITGKTRLTYSSSEVTITLYVTVTSNSNFTLSVPVGQQLAHDSVYYSVTGLSSDSPTIATAIFQNSRIYVTGLSAGTTYIRANVQSSASSSLASVVITVNVTGNTAAQAATTIEVGKTSAVSQSYASQTALSSDNPAVATVAFENGQIKITGVSVGSTIIRATVTHLTSGIQQSVTIPVTVIASTSGSTTQSTDSSKGIYLGKAKSHTVTMSTKWKSMGTIRYDGETVSRSSLLWIGSNDKVITVTKDGKFKTVGTGKANLIALTATGKQTAYVEIVVVE